MSSTSASRRESKHSAGAGSAASAVVRQVAGARPLTAAGTLVALGVLVLVLAGRWGQFARAAGAAPWWTLTAAAAIQTASLLARTEAWNVCVHAAGGTVGRRRLYRAAGVGYLGNIVNGELGFAARIASLRRTAPRETPKAAGHRGHRDTDRADGSSDSRRCSRSRSSPRWVCRGGHRSSPSARCWPWSRGSPGWPGATRADGGRASPRSANRALAHASRSSLCSPSAGRSRATG